MHAARRQAPPRARAPTPHLGGDAVAEHEPGVGLGDPDEALEHADGGAAQAAVAGLRRAGDTCLVRTIAALLALASIACAKRAG